MIHFERIQLSTLISSLVFFFPGSASAEEKSDVKPDTQNTRPVVVDEIVVWGEQKESEQVGYTSPVSTLTPEDLASINMATTEDSVKYEPSLVIRRRFIGDANGTLGMRGSNMFQTSRSMIFADGVPLHYLLETRWNGAPRWTMISASEIAQVDILYGPFSAEYSGNAMGGVVLIETAIPQQREFHMDGMFFSQKFDDYGFDDRVNGFKGFMSYGDKIGDVSLYFSYNHLDNESQPQTFYTTSFADTADTDATLVSGGLIEDDDRGAAKMVYGDSGIVETATDNFKFKAAYEFGDWIALLNVACEDRASENVSNTYVRDGDGNLIWGGSVNQNGLGYDIEASSLNSSELERDSLNIGLRLKGALSSTVRVEANLNQFEVLRDLTRESASNPAAPAHTLAGSVTDYGDTGWQAAEVKFSLDELGQEDLSMVTGVRYEDYELNVNVYNSDNYRTGSKDQITSSSGGKTSLAALFAQFNWQLNDQWDTSFGGRYEYWKALSGYFDDDEDATPEFDLVQLPKRSENRFSPKFTLGYQPAAQWMTRYSIAKAYRFPIVEELYSQYESFNSKNLANPDLEPEAGLHHNLMLERKLAQGYLRINLFRENIEDVIESQSTILDGGGSLRTFIPVDEVQTQGVEFIVNATALFGTGLGVRFNVTYTDSEIIENKANPSLEGNRFPRMPEWRSNLLATYYVTPSWDVGGSIQYTSDSFGRLDNADKEDNVYGAQDSYTRLGLKTTYWLSAQAKVSFGVDNLTDEMAYVAHPWPGRTIYLTAAYDL